MAVASREDFLLAGRKQGGWSMAFSIAATWIWAPALFVSSRQAYQNGIPGLFFFLFANTITLGLFGLVARRVDRRMNRLGYTFPQYVREKFDKKTHAVYLFVFLAVLLCSFATQLLAASALVSTYLGVSPLLVSVLVAALVLSYSLYRGLIASILTDVGQLLVIYGGILVIVPLAVSRAGGWDVVAEGLGSVTRNHWTVLDGAVFASFGIFVSLNHLFALYADQMHWQRAFAIREGEQVSTYVRSMACFVVVPSSLGVLGFLAAGLQIRGSLEVHSVSLVGAEVIAHLLPGWAMVLFALMLLAGLTSTLDSIVVALASLASVDVFEAYGRRGSVGLGPIKWSMALVSVLGIALANVPGITIQGMFLFYGMLRLSVATPTLAVVFKSDVTARGVFLGVLFAVVIAVPTYFAGAVLDIWALKLGATIAALVVSGATAVFVREPEAPVPTPS